jgi:transposase-like protein
LKVHRSSDGYRESTDSWAALVRDLRHRDMRAPVVAVGDGALGFWAALRDVFPETKQQRCWVHYEKCRIMWTAGDFFDSLAAPLVA